MQALRPRTFSPITTVKAVQNVVSARGMAVGSAGTTETLKSWKTLPGPSSIPFLGPILHFLPVVGAVGPDKSSFEVSQWLYNNYGPIVRFEGSLGRRPFIFTFDPDSIDQILRGENTTPIRPGFQSLEYFRKVYDKNESNASIPTGLITEQGEQWRKFRSTVNPVMLQPKTIKLYAAALEQVAEEMIQKMKDIRDADNMIKDTLEVEFNKWALESIGVVALGGRIGALRSDLPEDSPTRRLIQVVREIFELGNKLDFRPSLWRYFATSTFKKAMKVYAEQIQLSKHHITEAVKELNKKENAAEEKGVLEKLLEIDEDTAVIMASDMLFAGVDTAAHTMLGTLYLLAKNPEKQSKLREEVSLNPEKRPYLKACLKESLRIMPVVSGNLRQTTKEYNLMGYLIPKGMDIILGHEFLSKHESQYPKAMEFIPERWLVPKGDPLHYGQAHPLANSPFGYGVRSCIGRRIAELETETFLARVIENFEIDWVGPPPKIQTSSLSYVLGPYNFIFKDVSKGK